MHGRDDDDDDNNRRGSERTRTRKLVCVTSHAQPPAMYELIDLSGGGLRVRAPGKLFNRGQLVDVDIDLDGTSLEARGRIAHVTEGEVGIELQGLTHEARAALELTVLAAGWALPDEG